MNLIPSLMLIKVPLSLVGEKFSFSVLNNFVIMVAHATHWIFDDYDTSYVYSYIVLLASANIYFPTMLILIIRQLFCIKNQVNNPIRIVSTIHCISYLLSYFFIGLQFFIPIDDYTIFFIIYSVLFSFGHLSFYIFMLLRVYYSFVDTKFHGSIYTISVKMIYCHCFILLIDIVLYGFIWYFWSTTWTSTKNVSKFIYLSITAGAFLLFSIFHFIYTFNSKLLLFTINLSNPTPTDTPSFPNMSSFDGGGIIGRDRNSSNFSNKQERLLNAITKQTLLSCYSLFIIILLIILSIILFIIHKYANNSMSILSKTETITNIFRWFLLIERCTEITSIFLSMSMNMNDNLYQCLCKKCHSSFKNQCNSFAQKKIIKQLLNKQNLSGSSSRFPPNSTIANDLGLPTNNPSIGGGGDAIKIKSNSEIELQTTKHHDMNMNKKQNEDSITMNTVNTINESDLRHHDINDTATDDGDDGHNYLKREQEDSIAKLPKISTTNNTNTSIKRRSGTTTATATYNSSTLHISSIDTPSIHPGAIHTQQESATITGSSHVVNVNINPINQNKSITTSDTNI